MTLGGLTATVPAGAAYKSKALLHFSSVSLNSGSITAVGDDSVQVVDFLGNTTGTGNYTSADSVLLSRVAATADSGFAAFPVVDPVIIGDINGDGAINAADGVFLNRYMAGTAEADIPTYPGAPSNNPSGPDPSLSIPASLRVSADGTVTVPVNIDDPHPAGSTGMTQALLALTYDPAVLSVTPADIHLGTVPASGTGWTLQSVVDAQHGSDRHHAVQRHADRQCGGRQPGDDYFPGQAGGDPGDDGGGPGVGGGSQRCKGDRHGGGRQPGAVDADAGAGGSRRHGGVWWCWRPSARQRRLRRASNTAADAEPRYWRSGVRRKRRTRAWARTAPRTAASIRFRISVICAWQRCRQMPVLGGCRRMPSRSP